MKVNLKEIQAYIHFERKKLLMGIINILLCFFVCESTETSIIAKIVLCILVLLFSSIKLKNDNIFIHIIYYTSCFLSSILGVFVSQLILNEPFLPLGIEKLVLGALCIVIIESVLFFIVNDSRLSVVLGLLITNILTTVNYFVYDFRGSEFAPYDILSTGTALNVVEQYNFSITPTFVYGWVLFIIFILYLYVFPNYGHIKTTRKIVCINYSIIFISSLILIVFSSNVETFHFAHSGSSENGYLLNFTLSLKETFVSEPNNYSIENLQDIEKDYSNKLNIVDGDTNIIVIMNESFADFSILGDNFSTDEEVTPFLNALDKNIIKGYAVSSVYGGNTANSEFEFLTTNSMAFLPNGSIPYQQFLNGGSFSITENLNSINYNTIATHPYYANGWSRTDVYSNFGFDEYYFINSYPQKDLIRNYTSDQEMYDWIIDKYESNVCEKQFIFGITMQNHGGYDYEGNDFENTISLERYSQSYPDVEQYLTVLNKSDRAIEYLLDYFEKREEPVVVVFFGDHLPRLNQSFYDEVHGGPYDTLEEQMLMYTVPFFVWANYDIEEQNVGLTSLNYLSNYMYEAAGIPLPAYNQFLKELQKEIPAINAFGFYSKADECFKTFDQANDREKKLLNTYEQLQYNCMFDEKNRSEILFPVPSEEQINSVERHD